MCLAKSIEGNKNYFIHYFGTKHSSGKPSDMSRFLICSLASQVVRRVDMLRPLSSQKFISSRSPPFSLAALQAWKAFRAAKWSENLRDSQTNAVVKGTLDFQNYQSHLLPPNVLCWCERRPR